MRDTTGHRRANIPGAAITRFLKFSNAIELLLTPRRIRRLQRFDMRVGPHARTQHTFAWLRAQVGLRTAPGVIAVGVRHYGACYRPPRVDIEIAGRTVEP